eukprot:scaffold31812_cov58-Phaeocystis_antarctica.AAC.1
MAQLRPLLPPQPVPGWAGLTRAAARAAARARRRAARPRLRRCPRRRGCWWPVPRARGSTYGCATAMRPSCASCETRSSCSEIANQIGLRPVARGRREMLVYFVLWLGWAGNTLENFWGVLQASRS